MKQWGGRFKEDTDPGVERFTASIPFDWRLFREDIRGSRAHAAMLAARGVIPPEDAGAIDRGLREVEIEIEREIEEGRFEPDPSLEDVHTAVERRLAEKIGPAGLRLHTGRSRNDQVALDLHMYAGRACEGLQEGVTALQRAVCSLAERGFGAVMPGYTHLQRAQPLLFSHHVMAYFFMLQRDYERLAGCRRRADALPLGAAALAGTGFPLDPARVAAELGFSRIYENSLDAVADRDFAVELASAASLLMVHLSRMAEELVLWSSQEFAFVELDDAHATGSSIMPQKKNPDVAELVRGKTGRVFGDLVALLTVMKGLPLAYNRDMQEDKEPLFDAVDTATACLGAMAGVLGGLRLNAGRMLDAASEGYLCATELADYLARKGVPFREAHALVGGIVRRLADEGRPLSSLKLEELRGCSTLFEADALEAIEPGAAAAARTSPGGTAPERVREEMEGAARLLSTRRAPPR